MRRSLYVLFARLLAAPPDAALYARLRDGGLGHLAAAQGLDLTSDLLDEADAESSARELGAEYTRLEERVSLRASDYECGAVDPVVALSAYLQEHKIQLETGVDLPVDHLALVLGVMGELAGQAERGADEHAAVRARCFFLRHIRPWCQHALAEVASCSERRFYRGLSAMISAFVEAERRAYEAA